MRMRKARITIVLLSLLLMTLTLTGCRSRTIISPPDAAGQTADGRQGQPQERFSGERPSSTGAYDVSEGGKTASDSEPDPRGQTKENPDADRKEYDENAAVELVEGTERTVHGDGEGAGAFAEAESEGPRVSKLRESAEETATQTVAADEAEQTGVSEDAEAADSAMTYYTVLLQDRLGSLFECKRLNVYWETSEDHVTIFKTSQEHDLIIASGAYDVSARLLEENLRVDDGWIGRKNPQVIVKIVGSRVLGRNVTSTSAAKAVYDGLPARPGWAEIDAVRNGRVLLLSEEVLRAPYLRTAAALIIAKTAYPSLFEDADVTTALQMLTEEATGSQGAGVYYYDGQGGSL